jgi:hypothetical protein
MYVPNCFPEECTHAIYGGGSIVFLTIDLLRIWGYWQEDSASIKEFEKITSVAKQKRLPVFHICLIHYEFTRLLGTLLVIHGPSINSMLLLCLLLWFYTGRYKREPESIARRSCVERYTWFPNILHRGAQWEVMELMHWESTCPCGHFHTCLSDIL